MDHVIAMLQLLKHIIFDSRVFMYVNNFSFTKLAIGMKLPKCNFLLFIEKFLGTQFCHLVNYVFLFLQEFLESET